MMDKYEMVLGMEIHMQVGTTDKMFCSCKSDPFYSEPNTNVCPVCLGLPGALPLPNKQAVQLSQKMASALGGSLNSRVVFERKNYFYPDLPKGFQLTCPHYPISTGGQVDLSYFGIDYPIRWREIHLEEDTAKSMHTDETYIDFNKSSVPLLEMVTEPDFRSIDDAVIFCKEIQLIARMLGVSGADMEKGQMRLEANISVRLKGQTELPNYRVELKNINSFGFMKKALEYELRRQSDELEKGNNLFQETRGFDENLKKTFVQRSKEEANDYRYFPEPDIPPLTFTKEELADITTLHVALPSEIRNNLTKFDIPKNYIDLIIQDKSLYTKIFELINKFSLPAKKACTLCIDYPENKNKTTQEIFDEYRQQSESKISDPSELNNIIEKIINENPNAVADFNKGKENALQFMIGQIMKESKGKADLKIAREILLTKIKG